MSDGSGINRNGQEMVVVVCVCEFGFRMLLSADAADCLKCGRMVENPVSTE